MKTSAVLLLTLCALFGGFGLGFGFASPGAPAPVAAGSFEPSAARDTPETTESSRRVAAPSARPAITDPDAFRPTEAQLERARAAIGDEQQSTTEGVHTIHGVIRTRRGQPVAGALVIAMRRAASDPRGRTSDGPGSEAPEDPDLDTALARAARSWASQRGGRYRTTTGDDGRYELSGLPPSSFAVSAYKAGFVIDRAGGSDRVAADDRQDFTAAALIEYPAEVRLPDGTRPEIAVIEVQRDGNLDRLRWSPTDPVLRVRAGATTAQAFADFISDPLEPGQGIARLASEPVRLEAPGGALVFQLERRIGIRGRIRGHREGLGYREVRLLDLSAYPEVSAESFHHHATRAEGRDTSFEFLGIRPGSYAVGILAGRTPLLLTHVEVTVTDELVAADLEIPEPSATDAVHVHCIGPDDFPLHGLTFRCEVRTPSDTSSRGVAARQDEDGSWWLPAWALGEVLRERTADTTVTITAVHDLFGECSGRLPPGATELTLRYQEPCRLEVAVSGYAPGPEQPDLRVRVSPRTDQPERQSFFVMRRRSKIAEPRIDGTAAFDGLAPGDWRIDLVHVGDRGESTLASVDVAVRQPTTHAAVAVPPLHEVVLRGPDLAPGTSVWVYAAPDESTGRSNSGFQAGTVVDQRGEARLRHLPAGRYRARVGGATDTTPIVVPGGPYDLEAALIDCLRVSISDPDGPLVRAGLRAGDLVTAVNGVAVTAESWWTALQQEGAKKNVPLTVLRDGQTITIAGRDHPWSGQDLGGTFSPASSAR